MAFADGAVQTADDFLVDGGQRRGLLDFETEYRPRRSFEGHQYHRLGKIMQGLYFGAQQVAPYYNAAFFNNLTFSSKFSALKR